MKILKYIEEIVLFILPICLVGVITFVIADSNEKEVNVKSLVKNNEFKALHTCVLSLSNIKNIAVLPVDNYIVVDGTVINLVKRTYGEEPTLGFYINYYQAGDSIPYNSINDLLSSRGIAIDSNRIMFIVEAMKKTNLSDVYIENKEICYR
ncbi:hypothetical protein Q0590_12535 [Rhodocytophaga aerolata]|uniref:Uncharacterized protein n=1 Tax=Rhodocytophaga aerolata TaxID=455078 RepID=A0ABT8R8M1_9BACT|nr:hypothetical protein [Rhodocytophaga aerolata]MDO1447087.1 hypothetical protein [Rhodocytophaga aerolata]